MIDLGMVFDPSEVEEVKSYALLPAGDYKVIITGVDVKPTASGKMLVIEYQTEQGSLVVGRYNYQNSNETAVRLAHSDMKKIFEATGVGRTSDAGKLLNKRLVVRVVQEMGKPYTNKDGQHVEGRMQNELKNYFAIGAELPPMPEQKVVEAAQPAKQADAAPFAEPAAAPVQVKRNPFAK